MARTNDICTDIFENFVLHSSLTFAETIIYNYALRYETKEEILGYTLRFLTKNPTRISYNTLIKNYKVLEEYVENDIVKVRVLRKFERDVLPEKIYTKQGRPPIYNV